ncbi:MAG: NAD(P)H-dependent oxidoreductase subunit E [Chromatiales bacterium]|nr:NAD(P)H-dependent oxidoreductase subunit E [Chromatiales bacterium]
MLLSAARCARRSTTGWPSYPADRKQSAVLAALRAVQHENGGYLTTELMDAVADYLGHAADRRSTRSASFYSMFETEAGGPAQHLGLHQHLLHAVRRRATSCCATSRSDSASSWARARRTASSTSRRKKSAWPPAAARR